MNDNAISRAIRSTHFVLVSIILFFTIALSVVYLVLSGGITIEKFVLGPLEMRQLYIKWDKSLSLQVDRITLTPAETAGSLDLQQLHDRVFRLIGLAAGDWIGRIDIDTFSGGDLNASLHFSPADKSTLLIRNRGVHSRITLRPIIGSRRIYLQGETNVTDFNATVASEGVLDPVQGTLYLLSDLNVSDSIFLKFPLLVAAHEMKSNLFSTAPFASVAPIVRPIGLSDRIEQWIIRRAQGGPLTLHTLRTTLPYSHPAAALDNLYAHLTFENARYFFANRPEAFEPAVARHVEVVFQDKILNIVPVDATFYGLSGGSTWLDIDFDTEETLLTLYLNLTAPLTQDLHRLITSYGIRLPFVQTQGETKAELTLGVNLSTGKTAAEGHFAIRQGAIGFSELPVDVARADVTVVNSKVTISDANLSLFDARVRTALEGTFDPAKSSGSLHFAVSKAGYDFNTTTIALAPSSVPLKLDYIMSPEGDRIDMAHSAWDFEGHTVMLNAFSAPFDYATLTLDLPSTLLTFDAWSKAYLSGLLDFKSLRFALKADLVSFRLGKISSSQPFVPLDIRYDGNLTVSCHDKTLWKADETNIELTPFSAVLRSDGLRINPTGVTIENFLKGWIEGIYAFETGATELSVHHFAFNNAKLGELFRKEKEIKVFVIPENNTTDVIVPSLNMLYSVVGKGWRLHFFSLDALAQDSKLMREYNIRNGLFSAYSENGEFPVRFEGTIDYPYALIVRDGKAINRYSVSGTIDANNSIVLMLNEAIRVDVGKTITLRADHIGFNQPELTRFYNDHRGGNDAGASQDLPAVFVDANDSYILFGSDRKAIADRLQLQYENSRLTMQLVQGKGGIMLEAEGDDFFVYGRDLNDKFMDAFFRLSHFKGGAFSFYVAGKKDAFSGLARIEDTTVYDYVLLNNLFAFFNTVPALITFSIPGYETTGIKISSAYAKLDFADERLKISDIKVDSPEMDFAGKGVVDYRRNAMDMELSVRAQASENLRKIPIVGYILVGDDRSILTTVTVTGTISDPKISSTIAKDIVVAPFNILKRTLNFPLHYLEKFQNALEK